MYKILWWRILFGEPEFQKLRKSVEEEHISQGAITEEFESNFAKSLDVPYAVATTSGSVALLMALMALGISRDDEVIIPDRTWIATAHAALFLGAKAILVDVKSDIPIMDVSQIRRKITKRTKAIMPVHLNGRAVDMEEIHKISKEYGLYVIEDACQALYSKNSKGFLGTQSDAGCFSLGVTKLISTGQGGVVVTRNKEMYEKLKLVRNHGVVDNFADTWNQMGFNFKFTDLQASFGVAQLSRVQGRVAHVKEVYAKYADAIADFPFIKLVPVKVSEGEVPLYVEVLSDERERLIKFLGSQGIQVRPVPPNLHLSDYMNNTDNFPYSDIFGSQGMYLPCGPEQPLENVEFVLKSLSYFKGAC